MLITCNECNKEVSDKAKACPHCGAPINAGQKSAVSGVAGFIKSYFGWILILLFLSFVLISKPTSADFEAKLHRDILLSLSQQKINEEDNIVTGLIKLGCSLSQDECAKLIRNQMTVETKDMLVALSATVYHKTETTKCIGTLGNWWCWKAEFQEPRQQKSQE